MMSKQPVGEQRASKGKSLKWFSPPALAPHILSPLVAVRVTGLSTASLQSEAISLLGNCSFSHGFFLISRKRTRRSCLPQSGPSSPTAGLPPRLSSDPRGARSSAPGAKCAGGGGGAVEGCSL